MLILGTGRAASQPRGAHHARSITPPLRQAISGLLAALAFTSAAEAAAEDKAPADDQAFFPSAPPTPAVAPPGHHFERRRSEALIIGGSVTFGVSYLVLVIPSLIIAANGSAWAAGVLAPIGGPFVYLPGSLRPNGVRSLIPLLVADSVVQAAGIGMLIGGLVGLRVVVPDRGSAVRLLPLPTRIGNDGFGLGLAGSF